MLPGVSLTVLRRMDGPVDGYETVMVEIVIAATRPASTMPSANRDAPVDPSIGRSAVAKSAPKAPTFSF